MRKPGQQNVYEVADEFRRLLLAGERDVVNELTGAWQVAMTRIRRRLGQVERMIREAQAGGLEVGPAWLYRQERFVTLIDQIQREMDALAEKALVLTAERQQELIALGGEHADALLRATRIDGDFYQVSARALEESVGLLTEGSPLVDLFREIAPEAVKVARQVFAEGLGGGENPRKIAKRMLERMQIPRRRAVLIARTETLRSYRTAAQRVYEANAHLVTGVIVSSSRDGRTCPLCLAQDGKILKHREQFATHPACRCALLPYIAGYTPDRGTGEDWFRAQPVSHQKDLLGPSRYDLWNSGQYSLFDLTEYTDHPKWGKGIKFRPLRDLTT